MSNFIPENLEPDLNEGLLNELGTLDSFHDLPPWAIVVDRRKKNPDREKRDEEIISFIDSTSSGLIESGIDEFNVLDDEVRGWMIKIILMADRQRERMNLSPYSKDSILTLVYEIWYTSHLHRDNFRQSGENYAKSHLFESVINAIRDQGVSDIYTIVAILRHDDLEDHKKLGFDKPRTDKLLGLHYYQHLLTGEEMSSPVEEQIAHFRNAVVSTVEAVSIYKKFSNKEQKHELNFRRALEAFAKYGMRPTIVRIAERGHNHKTIDAKPKEEADAYIHHSLKVYPRFAGFIDLDRARENLIVTGYQHLEPDLLTAFKLESHARLNKRFGVNKNKSKLISLLRKVGRAQFIKFLAVNPRRVSHYVKGGESFDGLNDIADTDPMFEIVILVENEEDLEKAKTRIETSLKTGPEFLESNLDYSRHIVPQRGIRLEILNPDSDPELGGYLKIRINTVADEAKLDRGRVRTSDDGDNDEQYEEFLRPIKEVLERTEKSARGILEMVDEIGHGKNDIFTPDRDKISIPVGGTALAFAAKINTKLVKETRGARIEVKVEDKHGGMRRVWVPISPLVRLRHKSRVKIIKEGDTDFDPSIDNYRINHAWFEVAKSLDAQAIRKYLNTLPEEERTLLLGDYLNRLRDLVGLEDNEFIQVLLSKSGDPEVRKRYYESVMFPLYLAKFKKDFSETDDVNMKSRLEVKIAQVEAGRVNASLKMQKDLIKLLNDVDKGHLSPLKVIANASEEEAQQLKIDSEHPLILYFEVPDRDGIGEEISNEFKRIGVNFRFIEQKQINDTGMDRLQLSLDIRNPKTRVYNLLLALLRLSDRYKCVVISDTFKQLVPNFKFEPKEKPKPLAPLQS